MRFLVLPVVFAAFLALYVGGSASSNSGLVTVYSTLKETVEPSPGLTGYRFTVRDSSGHVIGYEAMACWRVSRQSTLSQCGGTLSLPRGNIVFAGTILRVGAFSLVVTGGDGIYAGADGSMRQYLTGSPARWSVVVALF